jgi:hypothetical protein
MKTLVLLGAMVLAGCGATLDQLGSRAAIDLDCPFNQIRVQTSSTGALGASGCGRRATYTEICRGQMGDQCSWAVTQVY